MKKVFLYIATAFAALSVQSCLHDNEDVFDVPAAERIELTVAADKALLESADNGWKFEYYLGADMIYGGHNILAKFKDGKAYLAGEKNGAQAVAVSSYDVTTDQGPVLSFDTYNEVIHDFAQPYSDNVEGLKGDYEFVIMKTTNDSIYLKGKKWGNYMLMTRLPETTTWDDFLGGVVDMSENIWSVYDGTYNEVKIAGEVDINSNWLYISAGEEQLEAPFIFTPKGIKLDQPYIFDGKAVQYFTYDVQAMTLTSDENSSLVLKAVVPKDWLPFEAFAGTYAFTYSYGTVPVTLVPDPANKRYLMKGLSDKFDVVMTYSKTRGTLLINAQQVGVDADGIAVWMAAWDLKNGGSLTWSTDAGVYLVWNMNQEKPAFAFADQGLYPGITTDSFILWGLVNGSSNGIYGGAEWFAKGAKSGRIPYWTSLVKTGN